MTEVGSQVYLLNYQFNQDQSCFTLATSQGFRTFTLQPLAEFSRRQVNEPEGQSAAVQLAAMLFQTNYVALVMKSSPYKVLLWDDSLKQKPLELWSRFEVLNVVLRRDILCVVSEYKIYVYEFGSFQVLLHLETAGNPRGVCALAPASRPWLLAAPGQTKGVLRIQNGSDDAASQELVAHNNSIACIALTQDGGMVATASEQGTVIKVFAVADGKQLFALRRGTTSTTITSLCFRADAKFLAVGSTSATVHIFRLEEDLSASASQTRVPQYFQAMRNFA
jgi:WD repeat-containing protein 45